jgi:hypothetical protein
MGTLSLNRRTFILESPGTRGNVHGVSGVESSTLSQRQKGSTYLNANASPARFFFSASSVFDNP